MGLSNIFLTYRFTLFNLVLLLKSGKLEHFVRKAGRRRAAAGTRLPNEVSGTRGITLDLFPASPYLRQTFTLFTMLLRARSGQLSFVRQYNNDAPVCRQQMQRRAVWPREHRASTAALSGAHTLDTHSVFNAFSCVHFVFDDRSFVVLSKVNVSIFISFIFQITNLWNITMSIIKIMLRK